MAEEKKAFFTYKGVPLVRKGNNIYFGNMYDEFVVMIEILSTEKVGGHGKPTEKAGRTPVPALPSDRPRRRSRLLQILRKGTRE